MAPLSTAPLILLETVMLKLGLQAGTVLVHGGPVRWSQSSASISLAMELAVQMKILEMLHLARSV
jgi:hypothetical protein